MAMSKEFDAEEFTDTVRKVKEDKMIDTHDTCQECFYKYPYVLRRNLEQNIHIYIPTMFHGTDLNGGPPTPAQLKEAAQLEAYWKNSLLYKKVKLPNEKLCAGIYPPVLEHPVPPLSYLAKLGIWETHKTSDKKIEDFPISDSMKAELTEFCKHEDIAAAVHAKRKLNQLLFTDNFVGIL